MKQPLRYSISEWDQLTQCLSNSSRDIKIKVSHIDDKRFSGTTIKVTHAKYGVLFAYTVDIDSNITFKNEYGIYNELTSDEIIAELEKYGFFISFEHFPSVKKEQIDYLESVKRLGFTKMRLLEVIDSRGSIEKAYIAFKTGFDDNLLVNRYKVSKKAFGELAASGSICLLTDCLQGISFSWRFLDGYIFNIEDVISRYYDEEGFDDGEPENPYPDQDDGEP